MADSATVVGASVVVFVVVLVLVILLLRATRAVAPYQQGVVTMFGSYRGTINPGLHFVSPLAVVLRVDLRSQSMSVRPQTLTTKDQRVVTVGAELRYRVVDPPKSVFQSVDYRASLMQETDLALQAELRNNDLTALISDPLPVGVRLAAAITTPATAWGVKVEAVTLRIGEANSGAAAPLGVRLATSSPTPARSYESTSSRRVGG
ncbi:MAG: hypothetical protein L3K00_05805 [Thermoplasmata archaeon]|nr:hypothetical protein [Thermoplasmata archaeon]